ncbi:DUF2442 domain-containing protein [Allomesorhizobium camelthorni]|uniref:DUF2442 domain-containing protein n=1 Tax=Allomesorhizobium camelthorni TaxID=475069 RepID=UPI003CCD0E45
MDYSAYFETDEVRPVDAWCDETLVCVTLADARQIRAPLWWYPFLEKASSQDRTNIELMFDGVWWPVMDEGISVKSMALGWKMPGAKKPRKAA